MGYFTKVSTNKFPSFSDVYEDKQSSTQDNTTNLDPSGAYFYYIYIWNYNRLELVSSIKKLVSSSEKIFTELVIPYIDFFSLNGVTNSLHILGIVLSINFPTSQKLNDLHWLVEILQWNQIGMLEIIF